MNTTLNSKSSNNLPCQSTVCARVRRLRFFATGKSALLIVFFSLTLPCYLSRAVTYDLTADWSDTSNPNGVWSYNEDGNPLPRVISWESDFSTGWGQDGWAVSANGTDRVPFWFRSNGLEFFTHDWIMGDIVVHTQDDTSGIGNGPANVTWTSPGNGTANISGAVWMGRNIGRANHWRVLVDGTTLTEGDISSGDAYDRSNPFDLSTGSGGPSVLENVPVSVGTIIALQLEHTSLFGDFVGSRFTVETNFSALVLNSAFSRKTHGSAGDFDLPLVLDPAASATVEPRSGGPTQIIFTFSNDIVASDGMISANEFTIANATFSSASISGNELTLNLTNVIDQSVVTIAISGIEDPSGAALGGDNDVAIRALFADVNQEQVVDRSDFALVAQHQRESVDNNNFLLDIDLDGLIRRVDGYLVKQNRHHTVP